MSPRTCYEATPGGGLVFTLLHHSAAPGVAGPPGRRPPWFPWLQGEILDMACPLHCRAA